MVLSVSSSSGCLGRAAACDFGTPWTFLLPFLLITAVKLQVYIVAEISHLLFTSVPANLYIRYVSEEIYDLLITIVYVRLHVHYVAREIFLLLILLYQSNYMCISLQGSCYT